MEICQLSRVSEQILHGRCSGIDNAVSTFGGLVRFANFARVRHSSQKDLLNNLKLRILLVGTRVPRNTKSLVESVRSQTKEFPSIVQVLRIFLQVQTATFLAFSFYKVNMTSTLEEHFDSFEW